MANVATNEVPLSTEEAAEKLFGTFSEEWPGKFQNSNDKYYFGVTFPNAETAEVRYHREPPTGEKDELFIAFRLESVTKFDAKITVLMIKGEGFYRPAGKSAQNLANQEMSAFVTGPQMVFGIELPHIMIHELNLKPRKLTRPLNIEKKPYRSS